MSDERVEELEQRVKELEATVRGLTEELVDTTERVRQLEEEHGLHETVERSAERRQPETDADPGESPDAESANEGPKDADAQDSEDELDDDIIVA